MSRYKPPHGNKTERSPRQLRVGEEIRHALAAALQHGDFPWPAGEARPHITVTEVRISADLRNATVFVMPLGGINVEKVVKALNETVHFFKNVLAHDIQLRWIPELRFSADTSFAYAEKIEKILHDPAVARDLKTPKHTDDEED
jgi:ribosome-binding factor A